MKTEIWFELGSDTKIIPMLQKANFVQPKDNQLILEMKLTLMAFFLKSSLKLGMYVSFV